MEYGYFDNEVTGFEDSTGMPIFDRAQNSQFMSDMYASLITSGVYPNPSSNLQVMERDDNVLGVKVMPGRLWIKGRFATEDEPTVLTAPTASTTANRIDIVVAELNFVERKIELKYITGGSTAPALVRNSDAYQIQLAQVTVPKNATRISQSNILDTRANNTLCGYVVGVITQIDGQTLFVQLKSMIDEEVEHLAAENEKISGLIADIQDNGFIGISTDYEEIGGRVFDVINAKSIVDADEHTIYVNATSGNDATGTGTSAKPYKTLQAAYEAIPNFWIGKVTIRLAACNYNFESSGSPNANVLDTRTVQKQCEEIRIVGNGGMTTDGTRLYGGIYLTGKPKYIFEKLWIFVPYQKTMETYVLINVGKGVRAEFTDCSVYGGFSSTYLQGRLADCNPGSFTVFNSVEFHRSTSGILATNGIVLRGSSVFQSDMQYTTSGRLLLAYNGGLIVFGGENKSSVNVYYESGGKVFT